MTTTADAVAELFRETTLILDDEPVDFAPGYSVAFRSNAALYSHYGGGWVTIYPDPDHWTELAHGWECRRPNDRTIVVRRKLSLLSPGEYELLRRYFNETQSATAPVI